MVNLTNNNDTEFFGNGNDEVYALFGDDFISAGGGNDTIWGSFGNDTILPGAGLDIIHGDDGIDTVLYGFAGSGVVVDLKNNVGYASGPGLAADKDELYDIENVSGTPYSDLLSGDTKNNVLKGLAGPDYLWGDGGNDTLEGGAGDDFLQGGAGQDHLDGGADFDTADYGIATSGVAVNLTTGLGTLGDAAGDTLTGIERLQGSEFADVLIGDPGSNRFYGRGGNDTIRGGGASDFLYGEDGADLLVGGAGADALEGGKGADALKGGKGIDAAYYLYATEGVALSLATGGTAGDAAGDTYFSIEVVGASNYNDTVSGNGGNNFIYAYGGNDMLKGAGGRDELRGGAGNDTVRGGDGNDTILGGEGRDVMTGSAGKDVFRYENVGESGPAGAARDLITDFAHGIDKIDLQSAGGEKFIGGKAFSGSAGEIRKLYEGDNTIVQLDSDGDGSADLAITLNGHLNSLAGDFLL